MLNSLVNQVRRRTLRDSRRAAAAETSVEQGVGLLLGLICRAHRNLVSSALDQLNVHVGQDHFVFRLAIDEGMTQSELAEALCLDASTVTKTLLRLERDGVVERTADSADGRLTRVFLTTHGRALVRPVVEVWRQAEERLVRGMTDSERVLLRRLLLQVQANLS